MVGYSSTPTAAIIIIIIIIINYSSIIFSYYNCHCTLCHSITPNAIIIMSHISRIITG